MSKSHVRAPRPHPRDEWSASACGRLLAPAPQVAIKRAANAAVEEGFVAWTPRNTLTLPAVCTAAGVMAGLLGLGCASDPCWLHAILHLPSGL